MSSVSQSSVLLAADARTLPLEHSPLDPADVVGGAPTTGLAPLASQAGVEVGIWEITSGVVTDVEADEVFVVLSGRGRVDIENGASILLTAGTTVRLASGDRTTWIIYETLRKVYVLLPDHSPQGASS